MSEWISVEDRLPLSDLTAPGYKCVRVIAFDGAEHVASIDYRVGAYETSNGVKSWSEFEWDDVTHWMPLPTPPKAD